MKKIILNPNCSEIVCRLFGEDIEIGTDSFPNGAFETFLGILKDNENKEFPEEPEYIDNSGGGGNWGFVESVYNLAKEVAKGEMSKENGLINEERIWNEEEIIRKCDICGKKPNLKEDKICICLECKKAICQKCFDKMIDIDGKIFCSKECKKEFVVDQL